MMRAILAWMLLCGVAMGADKVVRVTNPSGSVLYNHTVQVTVASADVPNFVSFDAVAFSSRGTRIASWLQESTATHGTYWLRVPVLPTSGIDLQFGHSSEPQTSWAPRMKALDATGPLTGDGDGGKLKTAVKALDGTSEMTTVHPKVVVAAGWMLKDVAAGPDVYDRVLVDTPWTASPPAGTTRNDHENPSIWCRSGGTWVWPDLTGFPDANNEAVVKPTYGNSSDPTILWVEEDSMPDYGGVGVPGPASDTLMLIHRQNAGASNEAYDCLWLSELTSTTGAWDGLAIAAKSMVLHYLRGSDAAIENRFISPGIVQEADGSLSLWAARQNTSGVRLDVEKYTSANATDWDFAGTCTLPRPGGMNGPYHMDVIRTGSSYWLFGSVGPTITGTADASSQNVYVWRSIDGMVWELVLPCALARSVNADATNHWFVGSYRPAATYVEGSGLELYSGSLYAGTGVWTDAAWSPTAPRVLDEPIAGVFWMPARSFETEYNLWPWPMVNITDGSNEGTVASVNGALTLTATTTKHIKADHFFNGPTNLEQRYRARVNQNNGIYPTAGTTDGLIAELFNANDLRAVWGSTTVRLLIADAPAAGVTIENYNTYTARRIGHTHTANVNGIPLLTAEGSPTYTTTAYLNTRDWGGFQITRRTASPVPVGEIDWYFLRDTVASEPTAMVRDAGPSGPTMREGPERH